MDEQRNIIHHTHTSLEIRITNRSAKTDADAYEQLECSATRWDNSLETFFFIDALFTGFDGTPDEVGGVRSLERVKCGRPATGADRTYA